MYECSAVENAAVAKHENVNWLQQKKMLHVLSSAALLALVLSGAHSQQQQQQQKEGDEPPTFPLISDTPFLDTNQFNPSGEREFFFVFRSANNPSAVSPQYEIRPAATFAFCVRCVCIIYSVVSASERAANWPLKHTESECCCCASTNRTLQFSQQPTTYLYRFAVFSYTLHPISNSENINSLGSKCFAIFIAN
jgi:hypothetical protein